MRQGEVDYQMSNLLEDERFFFLNECKDIVKTDDGYKLQPVACEDENGKVKFISHNTNRLTKNCEICIHKREYAAGPCCEMYPKLEGYSSNRVVLCSHVYNCDAYTPIEPLNMIFSEDDMIRFIDDTKNFFPCPEYYEYYYGFERKWDEETCEILETVREYYDRGGKFEHILNRYPCVIYFGLVDDEYIYRYSSAHLKWMYIGE